jgi:hypothetical protein
LVSTDLVMVSAAGVPDRSTYVVVDPSTNVPPILLAFVKLSDGDQILTNQR